MALQRPAYLQAAGQSAVAAKLAAGLGTAQPPRISLKDDRFTLLQASGDRHPMIPPALTLDVIFVGANPGASRTYYSGPYDAEGGQAPTCWSDNGVGPSASAQQPQAETCAVCPHSRWEHINANGNKVPACSSNKKIAVLVAGAGDTVYLLSVPPGSLKVLRQYMAHLQGQAVSPDEIVTRVTMESKQLKFDPVDFIPEAAVSLVRRIVESDEPDIVVGAKDKPVVPAALPAPTFAAAPQIAPAPAFAAEPPAPVAPPVVHETAAERELRELKAKLAAMEAQPAPASEPAKPARKPRAARDNETVVGAGPIPAATFAAPATAPAEPAGGFIGGPAPAAPASAAPAFGVAPSPQAAPSAIEAMLAKAFGTKIG